MSPLPGARRQSRERKTHRPIFAASMRNERHAHQCHFTGPATEDFSREYIAYRSKFMDADQLAEFEQFYASATRKAQPQFTEVDSEYEPEIENTPMALRKRFAHIPDSELAFFAAQSALHHAPHGREVNTPFIPRH